MRCGGLRCVCGQCAPMAEQTPATPAFPFDPAVSSSGSADFAQMHQMHQQQQQQLQQQQQTMYLQQHCATSAASPCESASSAASLQAAAAQPPSPNDSPLTQSLPTIQEARETLLKNLEHRPSKEELVQHNILRGHAAAPSLQATADALQRAAVGAKLQRKLPMRPTKQDLVAQNILKHEQLEPTVLERQQALQQTQLRESLKGRIVERPGVLDLVHEGIFKTDEPIAIDQWLKRTVPQGMPLPGWEGDMTQQQQQHQRYQTQPQQQQQPQHHSQQQQQQQQQMQPQQPLAHHQQQQHQYQHQHQQLQSHQQQQQHVLACNPHLHYHSNQMHLQQFVQQQQAEGVVGYSPPTPPPMPPPMTLPTIMEVPRPFVPRRVTAIDCAAAMTAMDTGDDSNIMDFGASPDAAAMSPGDTPLMLASPDSSSPHQHPSPSNDPMLMLPYFPPAPPPAVRQPEHQHIVDAELRRRAEEQMQQPGQPNQQETWPAPQDIMEQLEQQAAIRVQVNAQLTAVQNRATLPHRDIRNRVLTQEPQQLRANMNQELIQLQSLATLPMRQVQQRVQSFHSQQAQAQARCPVHRCMHKKPACQFPKPRQETKYKKFRYHEYKWPDRKKPKARKVPSNPTTGTHTGPSGSRTHAGHGSGHHHHHHHHHHGQHSHNLPSNPYAMNLYQQQQFLQFQQTHGGADGLAGLSPTSPATTPADSPLVLQHSDSPSAEGLMHTAPSPHPAQTMHRPMSVADGGAASLAPAQFQDSRPHHHRASSWGGHPSHLLPDIHIPQEQFAAPARHESLDRLSTEAVMWPSFSFPGLETGDSRASEGQSSSYQSLLSNQELDAALAGDSSTGDLVALDFDLDAMSMDLMNSTSPPFHSAGLNMNPGSLGGTQLQMP